MHITMIGTGYVGLVTGACFAEFGVNVTCVDTDAGKIERLEQGEIPIYEPGLDVLVARNIKAGRLTFTTDAAEVVGRSAAVFLAVGTPERKEDGAADLSYVWAAAEGIAPHLKDFTVVVTKSTVPVGTGKRVEEIIRKTNPDADFDMASNPEFLREGSAIEDFMRPDRVVIGTQSDRARKVMRSLYRPLFLIETPIVFTNITTAELTKYAGNAFLATKITFINEIANLCEAVGADVHDVAKGIGLDGRIGRKFLHPGPGYGGSCFPKDTLALVSTARKHESPITIVEAVVAANDKQKLRMVDKVLAAMGGDVDGKTIAVLGLAFKPNTDDMREAASLTVIPELQKRGALIRARDPEAEEEAKKKLSDVYFADSAYDACEGADAAVILTEWNMFRNLDLKRLQGLMKPAADGRYVFCDFRNIYEPEPMAEAGFNYSCIGR